MSGSSPDASFSPVPLPHEKPSAEPTEQDEIPQGIERFTPYVPAAIGTLIIARVFDVSIADIGAFAAAFAAFIAAYFSSKLTDVGERQTKLLANQAKMAIASQRAYVSFEGFPTPMSTVGEVWFNVKWKNSGDTPTKDMVTAINWEYFPNDIPNDFTFPDDPAIPPYRSYIGARSSLAMPGVRVPSDVIGKVMTGHGMMYIWGWIEYDDVFPETPRHRTEFCSGIRIEFLIINGKYVPVRLVSPSVGGDPVYAGYTHRKHNGADGECMKPMLSLRERLPTD